MLLRFTTTVSLGKIEHNLSYIIHFSANVSSKLLLMADMWKWWGEEQLWRWWQKILKLYPKFMILRDFFVFFATRRFFCAALQFPLRMPLVCSQQRNYCKPSPGPPRGLLPSQLHHPHNLQTIHGEDEGETSSLLLVAPCGRFGHCSHTVIAFVP